MPANAVVRERIDEKTKKRATAVLKSVGLTPSAAFRLMMTRIAKERQMPFEVHVPNADTLPRSPSGPAALDSQPSMGHSCDSPFGLQSYCLLVTNSFSGSVRMDNLLKDHRCPIHAASSHEWVSSEVRPPS
jgi:addiction module RelB/DinJ family antitoxin